MSRPQVGITRITPRRVSLEPRESMNCKSCRKRKIKCNRLRPSCEACKVFQCPCVYDAVPKKRGPKTDVLQTLVKRVDGLEKRLHDDNSPVSPTSPVKKIDVESPRPDAVNSPGHHIGSSFSVWPASSQQHLSTPRPVPPVPQQQPSPPHMGLPDTVLDSYFSRLHGKPFFILDEASTRQRYHMGQLPVFLSMAIHALTARYTSFVGTPDQSLRMGLEYALQARCMVDVDRPSIEGLQALLLLSQAFFAHNLGKKAYMTFASCVPMLVALDLYREVPSSTNISPVEKEARRRLFWSAYLMDRFITSGSKRPCLIPDNCIVLRLPSWAPDASGLIVEGEMFNDAGPNIQFSPDLRRSNQGAAALLVDITRILGITNRYLAAGGVKGDSHFPWNAHSSLSKIRQELDIWATGTRDVFASIETLLGRPESTTLLLGKLIYHLVYCLIYRQFLPIDLADLHSAGQHQSWQVEATNLCFSHSNAIAELVELGRNSPLVEWPDFVGFCVSTAGTVHVHGVHYKGHEGETISSSAELLAREMHQLSWLRNYWTGIQHQRQIVQAIYTCHEELVRNLASSPMRFSPGFHLEDFLDRYPGMTADGAHVMLVDMPESGDSPSMRFADRQDFYRSIGSPYLAGQFPQTPSSLPSSHTGKASGGISSPAFNFNLQSPQLSAPFPISADKSGSPIVAEPTSVSPSVVGFSPPSFPSECATNNRAPTRTTNPQGVSSLDSTTVPALTPDAQSQGSGSHTTGGRADSTASERDPLMSVLGQLAEDETSQGGPSELDFFWGLEAEAGCGKE